MRGRREARIDGGKQWEWKKGGRVGEEVLEDGWKASEVGSSGSVEG